MLEQRGHHCKYTLAKFGESRSCVLPINAAADYHKS